MKYFLQFLMGVLVVFAISCDSSEDDGQTDIGKGYFPLQKGLFQIYSVERTEYNLGIPTTTVYQLKTEVIDSFLNAENYYTYVVHRSVRANEGSTWAYVDTWSIRDKSSETVVNAGNLASVNLKYPVHADLTWNGNLYNMLGEDEYEIESLKKAMEFNGVSFNDCLTVLQNDNEDFIVMLDQRKEIYAKGIGLVYKDSTVLNYCTQPDCLGQEIVEDGVMYKQTIKEYGREE